MSTSVPFKFNTTASTNLQVVRAGQSAVLKSVVAAGAAAIQFLKIYWFTPTAANPVPVVGTTVPNLTFQIPTTGLTYSGEGIFGNGQLWLAVTGAAADSDATATAAGGVISVNVE